MELIKLELTPEECTLFMKFREYQDNFQTLWDAGVFTLHNGQAIIHTNPNGDVALVELREYTYRRRSDDSVPNNHKIDNRA